MYMYMHYIALHVTCTSFINTCNLYMHAHVVTMDILVMCSVSTVMASELVQET